MRSQALIGAHRACLHVPRRGGTTFKSGGGAGARLEEAAAPQLRGVGAWGRWRWRRSRPRLEAEVAEAVGKAEAPHSGTVRSARLFLGPMEAAAGGGCGSALPLVLSEGEQQCYSEIFARCTGAASGGPGSGPPEATRAPPGAATAAAGSVTELFRASQLPAETLHQVGPPALCPCGSLGIVYVEIRGGVWRQVSQGPGGLGQVA